MEMDWISSPAIRVFFVNIPKGPDISQVPFKVLTLPTQPANLLLHCKHYPCLVHNGLLILVLTWGGRSSRQLVLGVMGRLMQLIWMRDGGSLWCHPGSVQSLQSRQARSRRAGGWTRPLSCPYPSNGRIGLQDESGQGLSQVTFPPLIFHIWNSN